MLADTSGKRASKLAQRARNARYAQERGNRGINDLATLKPLLAQEWSEKNELKPTEVSVASHKKIIWKCKHGHEWEASVKKQNGKRHRLSILLT